MTIENIEIRISIKNKASVDAKIIQSTLNPDNLVNPPMIIETKVEDNLFEIIIKNLNNIETAIVTSMDILNSYELSEKIIKNIGEEL